MCTSPSFVWVKRGPGWEQVPVPCDSCWSCKENYVSDWVGRCLCEAATSQISVTLSLTYATPSNPQDFSHRVVNPYHFQLFMKRLRKAGHKVRYLVAGEYGELLDRAHFHAILFFSKLVDYDGNVWPKLENRRSFADDPTIAAPLMRQMPQQDMCHIREWPHGHVLADWSCSEKSVRYCCEYLHHAGKKNSWFSMSKKPALGAEWFAQKAARNREYSVMPSTFEYMPPGGKPGKKYIMTGATRRDYLNLIVQDREKRPFMSRWVRASFDKLERQAFKDGADVSIPWADDRFADREMDLAKLTRRLRFEDLEQEQESAIDDETFRRLADYYGIENNGEAFEALFREEPDLVDCLAGTFVPWAQHTEHCSCEACLAGRPPVDWRIGTPFEGKTPTQSSWGRVGKPRAGRGREAAKPAYVAKYREPTGFDRQGKPYWGEPGRDYLGSVFARRESGDIAAWIAEAGEPDAE